MRRLLVLLAVLLAVPFGAAGAQTPAVAVDGRPLPASAVVGPDTVRAGAFLRACGAMIESGGGFLEAWFPGGILSLSAGSAGYQWNAMPGRLSAPLQTAPDGAILASPRELGRILGLQESEAAGGLQFSTAGSPAVTGRSGPMGAMAPAALEAPGLLPVPLDTPFSPAMTFAPPPTADEEPPAPFPGGANPSPTPEPLPGGPGSGPALLDLASFTATRDVTGPMSTYRLEVVLENEGGQAMATPVELQFLVRGSEEDGFEVLDSDLVRNLPAGTRVTWTKGAGLDPATDSAGPVFRVLLLSADPGGPPVVLRSRDAVPSGP